MNIDLSSLALVSGLYVVLLFGLAGAVERGWVPAWIIRHPVTYTLSLGVYISGWAYFGSITIAYEYGYGFLSSYLGISAAYILAPVALLPILRLSRQHQLSSLADLFAFRFRSTWVGTTTSLFMLIGMLPLMVLQIRCVADTVSLLTGRPLHIGAALAFCGVIMAFTLLFGARQVSLRHKHAALVLTLAVESLIKIIAIAALGLYAIYGIFGGLGAMQDWLTANQASFTERFQPLPDGPWHTLLLLFFASAFVMPHMYQMAFTENNRPRHLITASWGFPLLLLVFSLFIPPILWACLKSGHVETPAYLSLGLGLGQQQPLLSLLVYIGGLAASSGLMIILTLALSGIALNHLVLPVYQPPVHHNIYRWLKWIRRFLISAILCTAFTLYALLPGDVDLSKYGVIAFVAALQFFPGICCTLYWPRGTWQGFIAGLIVGVTLWAGAFLWPLVVEGNPWAFEWIQPPSNLKEHWHYAALASVLANSAVFFLVSVLTNQSPEQLSAAEDCTINIARRPQRRDLMAASPQEFSAALARALGTSTAEKEVARALTDLGLPSNESRPYALRRLRDRIEANLSGLMGPSIAQAIVKTFLPYKTEANQPASEDLHYIESRLEEYQSRLTGLAAELDSLRRYHRKTLQVLPMGVCSLATDQEILLWNQAMTGLTGIPASTVVGSRLNALPSPWGELLQGFLEYEAEHLHKQRVHLDGQTRWLNLHKAVVDSATAPGNSGLVLLIEDLTDTHQLEEKLIHSERLASIGRLAAGVAHEIGNPVTGIACLAQNLREEREGDDEIHEVSGQIIEQTKRITRIVQSLMGFAHTGMRSENLSPVCLHTVAEEAINLLSLNKHGKTVNFRNSCDPEHWVKGDVQRLAQVLINLMTNARDASPDGSDILIRSQARDAQVDLIVEDHGSGIPGSIMSRLFEPFFTTKDPGKGTGLGLSLVYAIVEEHYGHISIESPAFEETGCGTRIRITLERAPKA